MVEYPKAVIKVEVNKWMWSGPTALAALAQALIPLTKLDVRIEIGTMDGGVWNPEYWDTFPRYDLIDDANFNEFLEAIERVILPIPDEE